MNTLLAIKFMGLQWIFILGVALIIFLIFIGSHNAHQQTPPVKFTQRAEFAFVCIIALALIIGFFVMMASNK